MKRKLRRIGVIALLLFVVVQPAIAPVAAQNQTYEDPWDEEVAEVGCSAGEFALGPIITLVSECTVEYGDVDGSTARQVHWDVYSDAVFMEDSRDQTITEKRSYIEQTRAIALARAKITLVRELNNGSSQAAAEDAARQAVTNVFAEVQKSLYISQNRQIQHWRMMEQQIAQTDNLARKEVYPYSTGEANKLHTKFANRTVTLYDGEKMNVTIGSLAWGYSYDAGQTYVSYKNPFYYTGNLKMSGWAGDDAWNHNPSNLNVISPDGNTTIALDSETYQNALTKLHNDSQDALEAVHPMAGSIYQAYDPGEVTVSDVQGPMETIVTSSTHNDALTYRLKSAAMAGYAVPTDGATVTVRADYDEDGVIGDNETKSGVIYSQPGAFGNNTVTTQTYNKTETNASVTFVSNPDDGTPQSYEIGDQQFTVQEIYTENGTAKSMTLRTNDFATTSTKDLNQQIDRILTKLEKLEKSYGSDGLFGGSGIGVNNLFSGLSLGVIVLIGLGVLVLLIES